MSDVKTRLSQDTAPGSRQGYLGRISELFLAQTWSESNTEHELCNKKDREMISSTDIFLFIFGACMFIVNMTNQIMFGGSFVVTMRNIRDFI